VVRKEVPGFDVFGLIDLNTSVGGLNMAAVEEFMATAMPGQQSAGRVIMLASDDTPYQLQVNKATTPAVTVVRNGQLVPEAVAIIQYAVKNNLTITTGHHNGQESVIIVREAIKLGMNPRRVGVTHANIDPPGLTVEQMQEVAKMGAYVEICTQSQRAATPEAEKALAARDDRIADIIKKVGAEQIIVETDLGQANNEYHPDGIVAFVRNMWARGISRADTDIMTKRNPARYLGIPEPAAAAGTQ
jgi:predicted metal-dependent phosphotriesterase family hydrolase